jgi:hypothetical protein
VLGVIKGEMGLLYRSSRYQERSPWTIAYSVRGFLVKYLRQPGCSAREYTWFTKVYFQDLTRVSQ